MGLSSNVMNMKFMQKAQDKSKTDDRQPEGKKVKDASEWLLPSGALKQKLKPAVTIKTVGYGSIASLTAKDDDSDSDEKPKPKTLPLPEKPVCFIPPIFSGVPVYPLLHVAAFARASS